MSSNTSNGCPYKGLQPYSEEDREYFFGRERDTEVIASNLYIAPLTILYGTSGVGKSSVLQAGVMPHLRADRRIIVLLFNNWQGENFHAALKETVLHAICVSTAKSPQEVLQEVGKELGIKEEIRLERLPLDELVTACAGVFRRRLLIIFDQFEEYFLYHTATMGTEGFDAEFARAVNHPESGVNFMISMREEELSKLDRFRPRIANLLSNLLRLENLDGDAANNAIRKPLGVYNKRHPADQMSIDGDLVTAIIEQVRPGYMRHAAAGPVSPGNETTRALPTFDRIETPFLQLVLMRLWEAEKQKQSHVLRRETFEELGGAIEIARTHLDKVMEQVTDYQRSVAAAVLRFLVTPTGSKIALDAESLASFSNQNPKHVLGVLELLGSGKEMRILRKVTTRDQPDRYELFHDVLGPAILDWRTRYVQAQQLIEQRAEAEKEFSMERQRRLRQAVSVLVFLLVVMAGTTVYAFWQRSQALEAQKELELAKQKAENAREDSDRQRKIAVLASVESEKQRQRAEAGEQQALAAQGLEAAARQTAEAEKRRANQQAAFAQSLVDISKFNLDGFDAARLGRTDESIDNFQKAYDLSKQQKNNAAGESYALINMADGYGTRGNVIPLELLGQFDNYEGTKYEDLLEDNYLVQSYGTNLEKRVTQEGKGDLITDQNLAIGAYTDALAANRRQKPDLKREAWIQQRIGDVYLSLQILPSVSSDDFEPDFSEVIKWYDAASDSYNRAGFPLEEGIMQTRIALLSRFKKNAKPEGLDTMISAYQRAREAFQNAGTTSREAATLIRIGETYNEFSGSSPEYQKAAIPYYSSGAALFDELGQFQTAGENYLVSADLSAKLTPDKESAFAKYAKAMTAFQAAETTLPPVNEQAPSGDRAATQIATQRTSLRNRELDLITKIGGLYAEDPKPRTDLKVYYNGVISTYANDHPRRASVLHAIAELYNHILRDKLTAIEYYRSESSAWKDAGDFQMQGKTFITIGSVYGGLNDRPSTKASFEEARTIYREMIGKMTEVDRQQIVPDLISIGKTYVEWGENRLAFDTYSQGFSVFEAVKDRSTFYLLDDIVQAIIKMLTETDAQPFFERLTKFYKDRGDSPGQASALERAADLYAGWNKPADAINYYEAAVKLRPPAFTSLARIGRLYYGLGREADAKKFFDSVSQWYRDHKDIYTEGYALNSIGGFYREAGKANEAIDAYTRAVDSFCKQRNAGGTANALRALSGIFQNLGDTEEATRLGRLADNPATVTNCDFKIKRRP